MMSPPVVTGRDWPVQGGILCSTAVQCEWDTLQYCSTMWVRCHCIIESTLFWYTVSLFVRIKVFLWLQYKYSCWHIVCWARQRNASILASTLLKCSTEYNMSSTMWEYYTEYNRSGTMWEYSSLTEPAVSGQVSRQQSVSQSVSGEKCGDITLTVRRTQLQLYRQQHHGVGSGHFPPNISMFYDDWGPSHRELQAINPWYYKIY